MSSTNTRTCGDVNRFVCQVVVGYSFDSSFPSIGGRAVLWDHGVIHDLASLTGHSFFSVKDINDLGQIVVKDGNHAFLLTPDTVSGLRIDDVTVTEGDAGLIEATFTVTRSGPLDGAATVHYATADGSADAGSDYESADDTLTFDPDESSKTVTIHVSGDTGNEADESFFVRLSAATGAAILDGQAVGTILNDDPPPTLSISDVKMKEGHAGVRSFVFTVSLSAASEQAISVSFATAHGTAKVSDQDYVPTAGTLTFAPNQTTQTITVQVRGDRRMEANERFFVNLNGAVDATILDGQGRGTIQNDDFRGAAREGLSSLLFLDAVKERRTRPRSFC